MSYKIFTGLEVILVFTTTVLFLMVAISFDWPLFIVIIPGLALLFTFSLRHGFKTPFLLAASVKGIKRNGDVAWLLFFIGMLLPTWHYSGTISDVNALFLSLISPSIFFTVTFLIVGMMSMIVGSSIASLSIVGVPLMTAAEQMGLPLPVVAGAIVSGGFVGDRSSPISSSFQLLRMSVEIDTRTHFKTITPTLLWGVILTGGIFLLLDFSIPKELVVTAHLTSFENLDFTGLAISLLPPAVLLAMILLGQEMKVSFLLGIGVATVILMVRGIGIEEWLTALYFGVNSLSGIQDMLPFVLFILIVGAYCQIMEETKIVQPYIKKWFTDHTSLKKNTTQTIGVAAITSLISPNQSFPILLTGRTLLPYWDTYFSKQHLSRILADSTVVFAGLVPWSLLAILCSTIVGVPVLGYAPFSIFLLSMPLLTFIYSVMDKREVQSKKSSLKGEEYLN